MRTACLVNCYNQVRFVTDEVGSAPSQSRPIDQIVIVDDGSTDGSIECLRERYGKEPS